MNEHFFIYNGSLFKAGRPVISSDHPGLLYGDGIFETMRVHHGKIINSSYHFKRLINSLKILDYQFPSGIKSRLNIYVRIRSLLREFGYITRDFQKTHREIRSNTTSLSLL